MIGARKLANIDLCAASRCAAWAGLENMWIRFVSDAIVGNCRQIYYSQLTNVSSSEGHSGPANTLERHLNFANLTVYSAGCYRP